METLFNLMSCDSSMQNIIDETIRIGNTTEYIFCDHITGREINVTYSTYPADSQQMDDGVYNGKITDNVYYLTFKKGHVWLRLYRNYIYTKEDETLLSPFFNMMILKNTQEYNNDMLLADMSHEIRTPLNGVIGYNQLLNKTALTHTQKTYISAMNDCSLQLMQIINDILDVSKINSGKMTVKPECFSLKETKELIYNTLGERIKEKKQKLHITINKNVPDHIICDKHRISQVLINLIGNSYKFSDIKGSITVKMNRVDINTISIDVVDNGIGIKDVNKDKIFKTFSQVTPYTNDSGSGLGLTISKKLAYLLKGDISFESVYTKGSKFTFTFEFDECKQFDTDQLTTHIISKFKDCFILVVDDNTDNRLFISDMLLEWNLRPIVCASGKETLHMLKSNRYNFKCGLIDICMPDISGVELAEQIKRIDPYLPLIAISSLDHFNGSCDFVNTLTKPLNAMQLCQTMEKCMSKLNIQIQPTDDVSVTKEPCHITSKRILIVEDNFHNRLLMNDFLRDYGFEYVDSVTNGEEAISLLESPDPLYDIIILDIRMPVLDGYKVIEHIKQKYIELDIIVTTASVNESDKSKCLELGIKHFITKPIDYNILKHVIINL